MYAKPDDAQEQHVEESTGVDRCKVIFSIYCNELRSALRG